MLDPLKSNLEWEKKEELNSVITKPEIVSDLDKLIAIEDEEAKKEEKIILNVNINSIEDLIKILSEKWYDLLIMEWRDDWKASITFKLKNVEKEKVYIQYPIYSKILLKIKLATKLDIEEINQTQEGKSTFTFNWQIFNLFSKTIPSNLWEKVYFSAILAQKIENKKWAPIWKFLWFLWILSLLILILWWAFLTFTVLKAKTVDDVSFFFNLWIDLWAINRFIANISNIIFSLLFLTSIILTIIYFFKFFLTKKIDKRRRVVTSIVWISSLIITFVILSGWMIIDQKVRLLPNWQELSYWYIQIYDNDKLLNKNFTKESALIKDWKSLIWPINIKYDLGFLASREKDKWFEIKKYMWNFEWDTTTVLDPFVIHKFDKKWWLNVSLTVEWYDKISGKTITKKIDELPPLNIIKVVNIKEEVRASWWKIVEFDASDLTDLWNIEWYTQDDFKTPVWTWTKFNPWSLIFKETIFLMKLKNDSMENKDNLNKIFIVWWIDKNNIDWEINYEKNPDSDQEFTFSVINVTNPFWNWYIKNYVWTIWNQVIKKDWTIENPEKSSEIVYKFWNYWDQEVKVLLINSNWKEKEIKKIIPIKRSLFIKDPIKFYKDDEELSVKYLWQTYEYFLGKIWTPTNIRINASMVTSKDFRYSLESVWWDFDNDWKIDKTWKVVDYPIDIEWNQTISVKYNFIKKNDNSKIEVIEKIYIEWIKKDVQLDLKIEKDSTYAPVIVRLDASKSEVKNEDIVKFIYDYWDWVTEERDAINQWHKYLKNWEYNIKLTVVTDTWKSYSIEKKLVLKPEQEKAQITTSLKKAPVLQWIDFSSDKSIWQISWYFWDFWDWENSVEANPTHYYSKAWIYKVNLRLDLSNNNSVSDTVEVEIYK